MSQPTGDAIAAVSCCFPVCTRKRCRVRCLLGDGDDLHDELLFQNSGAAEELSDLDTDEERNHSRQTGSSQASSVRSDSIAPEYSHLPTDIAIHLTRLKVSVAAV